MLAPFFKNKNPEEEQSAQDFIEVEDIKDNLMISKDRRLIAVIWVSAINLDLMSHMEQNLVFEGFEAFLSVIPDKIQFENVAEPVNLRRYLKHLFKQHDHEKNPFKRRLLGSYATFTDENQTRQDVVKKEHYVVVSQKMFGLDEIDYEDARQALRQTVKDVRESLEDMLGNDIQLETRQLHNQELLVLLQIFYNYQDAVFQPLDAIDLPQVIHGLEDSQKEEKHAIVPIHDAG